MRIIELFKLIKKDNRKLKEIFIKSRNRIDNENIKFNPICGYDENIETTSENDAIKNAKPIEVKIREISLYE